MENEIWKDIEGYEGLYQVSNIGNVKSMNYGRTRKEKLLNLNLDGRGYYYVVLCKDGIHKNKTIHRLVAMAFIPNPDNKREIDHIDTVRTNNNVENLQWATRKENSNNPISRRKNSASKIGTFGILNGRSIPLLQYSKTGEFIAKFAGAREAARAIGADPSSITKTCKRKRPTAGGFIWEYETT